MSSLSNDDRAPLFHHAGWAGFAGRSDRLAQVAVALICIAGVGVRLAAARGDLWLDEIWSLNLVAGITSAGQVFWASRTTIITC